jgi:hypothetical protein
MMAMAIRQSRCGPTSAGTVANLSCGGAFEVQGGGNVEKLAKTCEQHRGMRRPRPGRSSRAGTATLLRCVRLMLAPAIQQLSEGRAEDALERLQTIAAMLKPQKGGRNASA